MAPRLILWELCSQAGVQAPLFSPHTVKARLSLIHKGLAFETKEATFSDIKALKEKLGKRPSVPVLEFEDGSMITDSLEIAHYLEKTYPDKPSVFLPEAPTPVDLTSEEYTTAVAAACKLSAEFGMPAGAFPPFFGLLAPGIHSRLAKTPAEGCTECDADYFISDAKMGFPQAWEKISAAAADPDALMKNAKASIQQLNDLLAESDFLASKTQPGFVDFAVFGRYVMTHCIRPELAKELFIGKSGEWVARIVKTYHLEEFVARTW
ncbi:hypothetical protein RQP46_008822 [Phenoliferia psychrophenolica]